MWGVCGGVRFRCRRHVVWWPLHLTDQNGQWRCACQWYVCAGREEVDIDTRCYIVSNTFDVYWVGSLIDGFFRRVNVRCSGLHWEMENSIEVFLDNFFFKFGASSRMRSIESSAKKSLLSIWSSIDYFEECVYIREICQAECFNVRKKVIITPNQWVISLFYCFSTNCVYGLFGRFSLLSAHIKNYLYDILYGSAHIFVHSWMRSFLAIPQYSPAQHQ